MFRNLSIILFLGLVINPSAEGQLGEPTNQNTLHICKIHPSPVEPAFNHTECDEDNAPCKVWRFQTLCPTQNSPAAHCVKEHGTRKCTSAEKSQHNYQDPCFVAWQECGDGSIKACASGTSTGQSGTNTFLGVMSDWAGAICSQEQGGLPVDLVRKCNPS